jgi:CcmD family protein
MNSSSRWVIDLDDIVYFYMAYTIIWFGIFLYLVKMHNDQRRLVREIEVLEEVVNAQRGDED